MKKIAGSKAIEYITKIAIPICGVFISFVSVIIAQHQSVIAEKEVMMAEFVQPVTYTISYQDAQTEYQIIDNNGKASAIKALEPTITIESGAIKSLTAFGFDGEEFYLNATFTVPGQDDISITVAAQVGKNPLIIDQVFYDYLFIYLEPVDSEPTLDLVCAEVDLTNGTIIRAYRFHKPQLLSLGLDALHDPAVTHMLEAYRKLYIMVSDLEKWSLL